MKRFDRTWPTAIGAIGLGTFLGWATFGQHVGYEDRHSFDYTIEVPAGRPTPSAETQTSVRVGEHQLAVRTRRHRLDIEHRPRGGDPDPAGGARQRSFRGRASTGGDRTAAHSGRAGAALPFAERLPGALGAHGGFGPFYLQAERLDVHVVDRVEAAARITVAREEEVVAVR